MSTMVHPVSDGTSLRQRSKVIASSKNWRIIIYFIVALSLNIVNFVPGIRAAARVNPTPDMSDASIKWFSICFILSIPHLVEFTLDSIVTFMYPTYQQSLRDHRFGHGLVLIALFLPVLILISIETGKKVDLVMSFCVLNFCRGLALAAVFGKIQVFSKESWKAFMSLSVFVFYLLSQVVLLFGVADCRNVNNCQSFEKTIISCVFSMLALATHLFFAYHSIKDICLIPFSGDVRQISSNQYKCCVLFWIVTIFLITRVLLLGVYLRNDQNAHTLESTQIILHIVFALSATVLPGRMVRRDVVALTREMDNKKTFIRYISHEIRSPLATTSLGLDYLIDQMSTDQLTKEEVLEVVRDAKVTCEIATNTLNDMLMFDKIETGMLEIATAEYDAWEFVSDSVKPFLTQATSSGIYLTCNNTLLLDHDTSDTNDKHTIERVTSNDDTNIVSCTQINTMDLKTESQDNEGNNREITIKIDKHKMDQVIRNFLTNALKFSPQNSHGAITVTTSIQENFTENVGKMRNSTKNLTFSEREERKVDNLVRKEPFGLVEMRSAVLRVQVVDNGPGISTENLPKLFGQYVQFDANTLQGGKGSGLGLWLSKAIVEMHGGVIGATSAGPGQGCTFYLEIPCTVTQYNNNNHDNINSIHNNQYPQATENNSVTHGGQSTTGENTVYNFYSNNEENDDGATTAPGSTLHVHPGRSFSVTRNGNYNPISPNNNINNSNTSNNVKSTQSNHKTSNSNNNSNDNSHRSSFSYQGYSNISTVDGRSPSKNKHKSFFNTSNSNSNSHSNSNNNSTNNMHVNDGNKLNSPSRAMAFHYPISELPPPTTDNEWKLSNDDSCSSSSNVAKTDIKSATNTTTAVANTVNHTVISNTNTEDNKISNLVTHNTPMPVSRETSTRENKTSPPQKESQKESQILKVTSVEDSSSSRSGDANSDKSLVEKKDKNRLLLAMGSSQSASIFSPNSNTDNSFHDNNNSSILSSNNNNSSNSLYMCDNSAVNIITNNINQNIINITNMTTSNRPKLKAIDRLVLQQEYSSSGTTRVSRTNSNSNGNSSGAVDSPSMFNKRSGKRSPKMAVNEAYPSSLKVLLVDDSNIARKMVDRALTRAGVTCFHACNGLEALQMVTDSVHNTDIEQNIKYDIVMMDCYMPVMSGPDAVRAMKLPECNYAGIIVALSGSSVDGEFAPLLGQGVDRIMMKPFNVDTFFAAISDVLNERNAAQVPTQQA